jgi:NADH dehydrogenase
VEQEKTPRVVIVGGGFAGLYAARALRHAAVAVTLIDRKNHHTFQPLLYQVATAALSPGEIAKPIREILRRQANVSVLLAEVTGFDLARRVVRLDGREVAYDYLIVAAGAQHSYFGRDDWARLAPGLKSVEDALEMRRRILLAYELAERGMALGDPPTPLNFVVVGAGPTGVELAGAISEIARKALAKDFRSIDPTRTRVVLLEGAARVLPTYPEDLSREAEEQLRDLQVEVRTNTMVSVVEPGAVVAGGERIPSSVTLWAAGVQASPLGKMLGVPTDRAGRVPVNTDLTLPGHAEVYVVGDLAAMRDVVGRAVPGVAPAAIQQGQAAAANILRAIRGEQRQPFRYRDKGTLATIGRAAAVADFGRIHISGFVAWLAWLGIHIFQLIGFRNRVVVFLQWAWAYLTWERGARLITGETKLPGERL